MHYVFNGNNRVAIITKKFSMRHLREEKEL